MLRRTGTQNSKHSVDKGLFSRALLLRVPFLPGKKGSSNTHVVPLLIL